MSSTTANKNNGDKKKDEGEEKGGANRRGNINNFSEEFSPDAKKERVIIPKSNQSKTKILSQLKEHYLFSDLPEAELEDVINSMPQLNKEPNDVIIQQGDQGDLFYVLESGRCDIIVNGNKVAEYNGSGCFGELALMYSAPRAATILATERCVLWTLDIRTFRQILATTASSLMVSRCEFLRKVKLFELLNNEQISKIAGALSEEDFKDNDYIITQGAYGDAFYVLQAGTVKCTHRKGELDSTETHLIDLHAGDYFGEMALMLDEPRHANVIAVGPVKCLTLQRDDFNELLGKIQDVLTAQMRIRILKSVPLLSHLGDKDLDRVSRAMRVQIFEDAQYIIRQGENGSRFYIINEGKVKVTATNVETGVETELIQLSNQEYFGERALLKQEPRKANVIAVGRVECLVLERNDFQRHLGQLQGKMEEEHKRREIISTPGSEKKSEGGQTTDFTYEDLRQIRTVGTGTFGRVKLVQHTPTGKVCALKCMQKAQIIQSHQERNIMNEKNILYRCKHPFILELLQTYNTPNSLMMLMELVQGGELWTYIYEKTNILPRTRVPGGLRSDIAMFYSGCVISAFDYIHGMGVAYRDLKPENLLLSADGFLKVIDFGFAKYIPFDKNGVVQTKSFTLCGTPEYLSPELIMSKGHDKSVDYWALGCLIYELLVGHTPFQHDNQAEIFKRIIHSDKALFIPRSMDENVTELIKKLLTPNPAFRLGNLSGGVKDIIDHNWFKAAGFDWTALYDMRITPPYRPPISDPLDSSNFDPYPEDDHVPKYKGPQTIFEGF